MKDLLQWIEQQQYHSLVKKCPCILKTTVVPCQILLYSVGQTELLARLCLARY